MIGMCIFCLYFEIKCKKIPLRHVPCAEYILPGSKKKLSNTRTQILIILFTMSNIDCFSIAQQVIVLQIKWPVARSINTIFSNDH